MENQSTLLVVEKLPETVKTAEPAKKLTRSEKAAIEFAMIELIKYATYEMATKPRTTFFVTNYEDFELIEANRELKERPRLKEDLKKFGQLDPITVRKGENGKWRIINGQGRLHYLKELGYPVECIELNEDGIDGKGYKGTDFDAIKSFNTKGEGWNKSAYSQHYIKEGNENFFMFKKLNADFLNLSETIIYQFVNKKAGRLKSMYENGDMIFNPTPEQLERLTLLNELIGVIYCQRQHNEIKTRFDKPQIVKMLDEFLTMQSLNPDFNLLSLKKALRSEDEPLTKEDDVNVLIRIYKKYLPE